MMVKKLLSRYWYGLLLISLLAAGCQRGEPVRSTETRPVTHTPITTPTATRTMIPTPEPTLPPTETPVRSPTPTPIPLSFIHWDELRLPMTLLPAAAAAISAETAHQVRAQALWGNHAPTTLALSNDGQILAVGTSIGAYLYDSLTYQPLAILQTPFAVQSIAFSANDQMIALGQYHHRIDMFELTQFSRVRQFVNEAPTSSLSDQITVYFSPADNRLVSVVESAASLAVTRWDTASGTPVRRFVLDSGQLANINTIIDLAEIITEPFYLRQSLFYAEDFEEQLLPTNLPASFWEQLLADHGAILSSSDGSFLLIHDGQSLHHWRADRETTTYRLEDYPAAREVDCYDVPDTCLNAAGGYSWECPQTTEIPGINQVVLTRDDAHFLVSTSDNRTEFRQAHSGSLVWEIDTAFTEISFSPQGDIFFGLLPDGTIQKHAVSDGERIDLFQIHPSEMTDLAFSPDGSLLAAGYGDGWIRIYNAFDGELLGVLRGSAASLQFSPDGSLLAGGLINGTLRIYVLDEGSHFDLSGGHQARIADLVFSDQGDRILTGSADCTASLWGLANRNRLEYIQPDLDDPFQISAVKLSLEGHTRYLAGNRSEIIALTDEGEPDTLLRSETGWQAMERSPDGAVLAAAGDTAWLVKGLRSASGYDPVRVDLPAEAAALTFSPDGSLVIIATMEGLEFWSVRERIHLASLHFDKPLPPGDQPVAIKVSPDGSRMALGTRRGIIAILAVVD